MEGETENILNETEAAEPKAAPGEKPAAEAAAEPKAAPGEKPAAEAAAEPKSKPAKESRSLLDDEPKAPEAKAKPDEGGPTDEDVAKWKDGIKATDLGDGVKWDDEALDAITPELMKLSGNDPKNAEGLVRAYTKFQQDRARVLTERQAAENASLIKSCRDRFGDDLQKVVGYARRGGLEIFGAELWNVMKGVQSFANNPAVIERLAEFGRRYATDDGKTVPKAERADVSEGDVLHRMYGNVKVG